MLGRNGDGIALDAASCGGFLTLRVGSPSGEFLFRCKFV
jgi:hypothetical protein